MWEIDFLDRHISAMDWLGLLLRADMVDESSIRIAGIPELRYTPRDHAPHLMVHSFNRSDLRAPVLEAPALGMAKKAGE